MSGTAVAPRGTCSDHVGAALGGGGDAQLGVDEGGAFVHSADPARRRGGASPSPRPSSLTRTTGGLARVRGELSARGLRVADDVGQRLLGDAVDHQLLVVAEDGQIAVEASRDRQSGLLGETAR